MCTVTFIARKTGYALGMNRDEQRSRMAGLAPAKQRIHGVFVLAPSEPGGGTWISLNEAGITFALINWYAIPSRVTGETVSRGKVVTAACAALAPDEAATALARLPLPRINPFRLIGVFPATKEIVAWRWDLKCLVRQNHPWQNQQWISSGFNEPAAQQVRSRSFRATLKQKSAGQLDWLRRLHRSHSPRSGPFSTCMHRNDAATVSYTEVAIFPTRAAMNHHVGPLCLGGDIKPLKLALKPDAFSLIRPAKKR